MILQHHPLRTDIQVFLYSGLHCQAIVIGTFVNYCKVMYSYDPLMRIKCKGHS